MGFPGTISLKFLLKSQRYTEMSKVPNGVETLPKISIAWVGCTNVRDRQTDGRTMTYSHSLRSLKKSKRKWKDGCVIVPGERWKQICHIQTIANNCNVLCRHGLKIRTKFCMAIEHMNVLQRYFMIFETHFFKVTKWNISLNFVLALLDLVCKLARVILLFTKLV